MAVGQTVAGSGQIRVQKFSVADTNYLDEQFWGFGIFIENEELFDAFSGFLRFDDLSGTSHRVANFTTRTDAKWAVRSDDETANNKNVITTVQSGSPGSPAADFIFWYSAQKESMTIVKDGAATSYTYAAGEEPDYTVNDIIELIPVTGGNFKHYANRWFILGLGGTPPATPGVAPTMVDIARAAAGEHPSAIWGTDSDVAPYVWSNYEFRDDITELRLLNVVGGTERDLIQNSGAYQNVTDAAAVDKPRIVRTDQAMNLQFAGGVATTVRIDNPSHGWLVGTITAAAFYLVSETEVDADAADISIAADAIIGQKTGEVHLAVPDGWYLSVFHATNAGVLSIAPTISTPHTDFDAIAAANNSVTLDAPRSRFLGPPPIAPAASLLVAPSPLVTNQLDHSETFSSWATQTADVTANTTTAPDGTTTADTIDDVSAAATELITSASVSYAQPDDVYFAVAVKKNAVGRAVRFAALELDFAGSIATLNIDTNTGDADTGATGTATIVDARIQDHPDTPDDYWLAWMIANDTVATDVEVTLKPAAGASATWATGVAATGANIFWGAQLTTPQSIPARYAGPTITTPVESTTPVVIGLPLGITSLYHQGINEYSKLSVTPSATSLDYGSSATRLGTPKSLIVSGDNETRIPLPAGAIGDYLMVTEKPVIFAPGDSVVITGATDGVSIPGVPIRISKGAHTHIALIGFVAGETGYVSIAPTVLP